MPTPLLITVAGVGAELTKKQTPYLPASPEEIIADAIAVSKLGAHIYHLHVRDSKGRPTLDLKILRKVIAGIRKHTGLIVQVSTGGSIEDGYSKRIAVLNAKPDMASLTLGSVNFGNDVFLNPRPFIEKLAAQMLKKKIIPEVEIFDVGMVDEMHRLIDKGLLNPPHHANIILGGPGWLSASEENLKWIVKKLPKGTIWSGSGVGKWQKPMIEWSIKLGGHVRTGLEDNIYISKGILAKGNSELVEQAKELAKKYKRN